MGRDHEVDETRGVPWIVALIVVATIVVDCAGGACRKNCFSFGCAAADA